MSEEKYSPEQIELTQKVVQEVIQALENPDKLLEEISKSNFGSYDDVITSIHKSIDTRLSEKKDYIIGENTLSRGIFTAIVVYSALFFISKGLERRHGYKLDISIFRQIPYSMMDYLAVNIEVLGIKKHKRTFRNQTYFLITTRIPLTKFSMLMMRGDKTRRFGCPYTQNSIGKKLNIVLSDSLLNFFRTIISKNFNTFFGRLLKYT